MPPRAHVHHLRPSTNCYKLSDASTINAPRLVGPSLAGLLIATVGEGICFLLNGLSYLAVLAALLVLRLPPRPPAAPRHACARWGPRRRALCLGFCSYSGNAPAAERGESSGGTVSGLNATVCGRCPAWERAHA